MSKYPRHSNVHGPGTNRFRQTSLPTNKNPRLRPVRQESGECLIALVLMLTLLIAGCLA